MSAVHKKLDITRVRDYDSHDVYSYDLVKDGFLFDSCGLMKKPSKHELVKELKTNLEKADYIPQAKWTDMPTGYIFNVMCECAESPNIIDQHLSTLLEVLRDANINVQECRMQ